MNSSDLLKKAFEEANEELDGDESSSIPEDNDEELDLTEEEIVKINKLARGILNEKVRVIT
ncbi:MAG TPA: hypothetical protein ENI70_00420 [Candidatus Peregrinibacteria bacterium]|nr:hypothetical protein [Candidatus Peregrinibacteria bacterium]